MKLQHDIYLNRSERNDLNAPSRHIAPRLLYPLWAIAIREAQVTVTAADRLDELQRNGLADDVEDSAFMFTVICRLAAEIKLCRLQEMTHMVMTIDIETLPSADVSVMTQLEFDF